MLYGHQMEKHGPSIPAEQQFINVEQGSVIGKITLDGAPNFSVLSPAGQYLYLIEKENPYKKFLYGKLTTPSELRIAHE